MKIVIVASDYFPTVGGVQTAVRNIARNSIQRGHSVIILSSLPPGKVPAQEMVDGVRVHRFPWGRRPLRSLLFRAMKTLFGMARVIRDFKPDLVYIHFLTINALYVLLLHYVLSFGKLRTGSFQLIASARGNDIQGIPLRSRLQRWMLTHLFKRSNAILFCSAYVQRDAAPYLKNISPRTFVGVVGDGFDPAEFQSPRPFVIASHSERSEETAKQPPRNSETLAPHASAGVASSPKSLLATTNTPYLLAMGRLVHKKGFDFLIRAFASIADEFPRVQLLIAGDGEERATLEKLIDDLNLRARVVLLGFTDRAKTLALFWGCEFFVLSSRLEPFGIVVAEAMAAHKAVLATRSGGVIDLMQPGVNGLLVEPEVDALANGMRQMLAHPDETRAMGERAAQSIQRHTWAAVTDEFLAVFQRVVESK